MMRLPPDLIVLKAVPYQAVDGVSEADFITMVKLLDFHMVRESIRDFDGVLETLIEEPLYVMEYLPFQISGRLSSFRKYWRGRDAVRAYYQHTFATIGRLDFRILRYRASPRGIVAAVGVRGVVAGCIPIHLKIGGFMPFDSVSRKFTGERIYLTERGAMKNL
jgi:hypothetical protein